MRIHHQQLSSTLKRNMQLDFEPFKYRIYINKSTNCQSATFAYAIIHILVLDSMNKYVQVDNENKNIFV